MAYYSDEHDEDDMPVISLPTPHYTRRLSSSDDDDRSSKLLDSKLINQQKMRTSFIQDWRNLYETSINSLQSDDEEHKSFHLDRPPSMEKSPMKQPQRPPSPIYQFEIDPNTSKSKWQIRPAQLLNSMVGPDRQVNK